MIQNENSSFVIGNLEKRGTKAILINKFLIIFCKQLNFKYCLLLKYYFEMYYQYYKNIKDVQLSAKNAIKTNV